MSRLHISFRGPVGPMTREASVDPQVCFEGRSKLRNTNYFINVVTLFNFKEQLVLILPLQPPPPHPHEMGVCSDKLGCTNWSQLHWYCTTESQCFETVVLRELGMSEKRRDGCCKQLLVQGKKTQVINGKTEICTQNDKSNGKLHIAWPGWQETRWYAPTFVNCELCYVMYRQ